MLEKANELDSIRQEMEKEYYKNLNLAKQKKILKRTSLNRPKELKTDLFKSIDRNESYRSKHCQSSIDLDTKIDIRGKFPPTFALKIALNFQNYGFSWALLLFDEFLGENTPTIL